MIERSLEKLTHQYLVPGKVVLIMGARRVGKTTLLKKVKNQAKEKVLYFNGDDIDTHELFAKRSVANFKRIIGDHKMLIFDEAQEIADIGKKLKLIVDEFPHLKILVSGSPSFDLNNKTGEPLVGRAIFLRMHPFAQSEIEQQENAIETKGSLEDRLIYGSYPDVWKAKTSNDKKQYLKELVNAYLLKDVLSFDGIQKSDKLLNILKMLAFRVGSEVSIESMGNDLGLSKNTVDRYLDLLTKVFVVYRLDGFSKNLDNEITKKSKWYFYDNGIRNALINNFNPLSLRDDNGKIWENYLLTERIKKHSFNQWTGNMHFWRTHTKQEIDLIEEENENLNAFEFKLNPKKKIKVPTLWQKAYQKSSFSVIDQENYLNFIS
jgi:uncharacterized protein